MPAAIRAAGDRYIETLGRSMAMCASRSRKSPPAKRRVITSHDAFGYFGGAYGVEFLAPEGISTESEPSASDLAKLIDQIKREHIKTLFVENITDPRMIDMIAKETGTEVGGALYSDALSPADGPAPHYADMLPEQCRQARRRHAQKLDGKGACHRSPGGLRTMRLASVHRYF